MGIAASGAGRSMNPPPAGIPVRYAQVLNGISNINWLFSDSQIT